MTNSVWQAAIQNAAGDIVPGAEITVIDEGTGLNAVIYSSKAGAALTNPFNADAGGFAQFYSGPGEYRITAFDIGTGLTQTFDNWRLGDAGARDVGIGTDEVPLNSDLGTAAVKDTGTATGQVLLSESAGLDNGEKNYTSGVMDVTTPDGELSPKIMKYVGVTPVPIGGTASGSSLRHTWVDSLGVVQSTGASIGTWKNLLGAAISQNQSAEFVRIS